MMNAPKSSSASGKSTTTPPTSDDAPGLTLQDILQTSPVESHAESILFRSIMETVANETAPEVSMNILESIPDESVHLFTTSPMSDDDVQQLPAGDPLDIFSSCATSPRSPNTAMNHNTIARPCRVTRFASHSPPRFPQGRAPKKSSSVIVSSKQQRPSQLATMAQRWDAFQHVSSHPSKSKLIHSPRIEQSTGAEEIQMSVPSAAEIMVLQHRRSDGRRQPSIQYMTAASTSPPVAPPSSILCRPDFPPITAQSSPESLKLYKKTDSFVEEKVSLDGAGNDVECGGVATKTSTVSTSPQKEEKMDRRHYWAQGFAWCKSQIKKPSSHSKLILHRLLPPQQHTIWNDFEIFLEQRRDTFFHYARFFLWIVLPALVIAFILFYFAGKCRMFLYMSFFIDDGSKSPLFFVNRCPGNPPTGKVDLQHSGNGILVRSDGTLLDPNRASISWWLLFICVRIVA